MIFRYGIIFDSNEQDSSRVVYFTAIGYTGNIVGALLSAPIANKWGRKNAVLVGCMLFIVGASVVISPQDIANTVPSTIAARLAEGLANGISTTVIPYICEA